MKIDISTNTFLKVVLIILGLVFLWAIRDVIILVLLVFVIVAALGPIVDKLQRFKIPRFLSVIIVYSVFIGAVIAMLSLFLPPLINQIKEFAQDLPSLYKKLVPVYQNIHSNPTWGNLLDKPVQSLSGQLNNVANSIFSIGGSIFTGLGAIVAIIVLTFYLLLEENGIRLFIKSLVPYKKKEMVVNLFDKVSEKWGGWLRGQFILMVTVGLVDYVGLMIFHIPFALPLALFAGFFEIIPYLGPILGAVPAVLVALTFSPWAALFIAIWYFVVQQLENYILVPKVMQKTVGLSPVVTIIAIIVGAKLLGILGVVIAVPVAAGISVFYNQWQQVKNKKDTEEEKASDKTKNTKTTNKNVKKRKK
jgi:predicted PurR-regulated permease PerM